MKKKDEIAAELKALEVDFGDGGATDIFHTPPDYFLEFPDQMTAIIKAMNADTSLELPVAKTGPFSVPPGYFESLSNDILAKTSAMDKIINEGQQAWSDTGKKNPYSIPENYFAQFEEQLFHKIFKEETAVKEELTELSPLLAGLKKEQPFAVPAGYFNSETFTRKAQQQPQETKVMEHPSVRSIKWARWAAAAAVIFIFALGGMHYLNAAGTLNTNSSFEQDLAKIPEQNIKEWLSSNMDESDINNLGGSIANINTGTTNPALSNFSEQEIRDYLETEVW